MDLNTKLHDYFKKSIGESGNTLRQFTYEETDYRIVIFSTEDDRTEVLTPDNLVLLTFTAGCEVVCPCEGERFTVGHIQLRDNRWFFQPNHRLKGEVPTISDCSVPNSHVEAIFDLELVVAKQFVISVLQTLTEEINPSPTALYAQGQNNPASASRANSIALTRESARLDRLCVKHCVTLAEAEEIAQCFQYVNALKHEALRKHRK